MVASAANGRMRPWHVPMTGPRTFVLDAPIAVNVVTLSRG